MRDSQRRFLRQRKKFIQINLLRDGLADLPDLGMGRDRLVARHQAEMALNDGEAFIVLDRADHRHVGVMLDDLAQLGFVARAAKIVENDAGDVDVAIERLVTEDQRRDAARHAARVDHQHHRQIEQHGQRGIAVAAVER